MLNLFLLSMAAVSNQGMDAFIGDPEIYDNLSSDRNDLGWIFSLLDRRGLFATSRLWAFLVLAIPVFPFL